MILRKTKACVVWQFKFFYESVLDICLPPMDPDPHRADPDPHHISAQSNGVCKKKIDMNEWQWFGAVAALFLVGVGAKKKTGGPGSSSGDLTIWYVKFVCIQ